MPGKMWEDKCWGKTRCVFLDTYFSQHVLQVVAGGFCSWHYHYERANRFTVRSGVIEVCYLFGPRVQVELLSAQSQSVVVPSMVVHQFRVRETGIVVEDYWPDRGGWVDINDIERLIEGGPEDRWQTPQQQLEALLKNENP